MAEWKNETEMFSLMKAKLYTPVVGDILDAMGYTHQFMPPYIRPLKDEMKLAGKACPVLEHDVFGVQEKPFGLLTEALDQLEKNEIYVATGAHNSALWGEILTATAKSRGSVGAVVDGWHRDTPQVLSQNWPVFSQGCWAQDSSIRTNVVDFRCPIEIGQVTIENGDIIFGDIDGVLVIPGQVAEEVIEKALAKAAGEKVVRKAIEAGMSATAAFEKYGIL
ncbi:RraA family protein [Halanaerobium salsuginis]|uniref:Putative 4-hydroxy-4-methyl-2-oxoglutarate aldolase n=1 Tax=Halanaerobium salsuginis TaxID=29563 RepID=A0A1I4IPY8_9FIRM|nr:RraA family protein [Halanaerobium salsuginis]SFL55826.1 Regulator of RNase E activity RraA [Halanaerobium salsuginis]